MMGSFQKNKSLAVPLGFIVCILYWLYLLLVTKTIIFHDSIGYEQIGRLIYEDGIVGYLKKGPQREPLYPLLTSVSMHLADTLNASYITIQKIIQVGLLFITQILTLKILQKLKINEYFTALTILYVGISPTLLNSALCIYSEIITYPLIVGLILVTTRCWFQLQNDYTRLFHNVLNALLLSVIMICLTFSKGAFEFITPIYMSPFYYLTFRFFLGKNKKLFKNSLTFLIVFLLTFYSSINLYKLSNKIYNGEFTITYYRTYVLYGNTTRRMMKLTPKRLFAAVVYITGMNNCLRLADETECHHWDYPKSDLIGHSEHANLSKKGYSDSEINKILMERSMAKMFKNPFQAILLTGLEALKFPFWEFRSIAYVSYPDWIDGIHHFQLLRTGIKMLSVALTFLSLIYASLYLWRKRIKIFEIKNLENKSEIILTFIGITLILFIGIHSLFYSPPRYAFPIVPLFIILIIFTLNSLAFSKKD